MFQNPAADPLCVLFKALYHLIISLMSPLCTVLQPNRVKLTPQANLDTLYNTALRQKEITEVDCRGKLWLPKSDSVKTQGQTTIKRIHHWPFNISEETKSRRKEKVSATCVFIYFNWKFPKVTGGCHTYSLETSGLILLKICNSTLNTCTFFRKPLLL